MLTRYILPQVFAPFRFLHDENIDDFSSSEGSHDRWSEAYRQSYLGTGCNRGQDFNRSLISPVVVVAAWCLISKQGQQLVMLLAILPAIRCLRSR